MTKHGPWDEDSMWVPDSNPWDEASGMFNAQYGVRFQFDVFSVFTSILVDRALDSRAVILFAEQTLAEQGFDVDAYGEYTVEVKREAYVA